MANIKNFGIVGVGAGVQFGKGGAQLIQTAGTFAAKNAAGNAFVRFQIADGSESGDAITFGQHTNAVTSINANVAAVASDVSNTITGAGLGADGHYVAPVGTNYLANATSLADADAKLDAALFAEAATRAAADSALANSIANIVANEGSVQAEVDLIETSVGLGTDGSFTITAGNYLANAVSVVDAVEILDGAIGNVSAVAAAAESNAALALSEVTGLTSDLANTDAAVAGLTSDLANTDANVSSVTGLVSGLTSDVANTNSNVATLTGRVEVLENSAVSANAAIAAEANARIAADNQLSSDITNAAAVAAQATSDEANARIAADAVNAGLISDEANARIAADAVNAGLISDEANARIAADGVNAAAISAETNARVAADSALSSDIANTAVALIQLSANAVLKDGSVTMTGNLDMGGFNIVDLATPTTDFEAATKKYVDDSVGSLSGAFLYQGTVDPGPDAGNAVVMNASAQPGWYYKATSDGYLIGADDGALPFHVFLNDGVVHNNSGNAASSWDVLSATQFEISAGDSSITVDGSVDTGYQVSVSATYTAARQQEVSDEANARIAGDALTAGAVSNEANARIAADAALSSDIGNAVAAAAQATSDEANARIAADTQLGSDITNAAAVAAQATSDEANARIAADGVNAAAISAETNARVAADAVNAQAISDETNARVAADSVHTSDIANTNANVVTLTGRVEVLENSAVSANAAIAAEANARIAADNQLSSDITNAVAAAAQATSDEANARIAADGVNAAAISAETNARVAADAVHTSDIANAQAEIDAIEAGAGLSTSGAYVANAGANYIATANTLANADDMLDNAIAALAETVATLSQDTIKTIDDLNYVHVAEKSITMALDVGGNAAVVVNAISTANTNTSLVMDFGTSDQVKLGAQGTNADVDLRLAAQGAGHVIIGETGVGVIQADDGYDMTVAGGTGANLNLLGDVVNIGDASGTNVAVFAGTVGATAWATVTNGNTSVTFGAAGAASNLDLVFAPKGTGVVNMSSARVINVANATASTDAVNKGQLDTAISTASVGVVKTVTAVLPATSGEVALGTITGTVLRVRVLVTGAYDAGSTITVGKTGGPANDLADSTDIDESTAGIYVIETAKDYSAVTVSATVTNATGTNGSAKVVVEYLSA